MPDEPIAAQPRRSMKDRVQILVWFAAVLVAVTATEVFFQSVEDGTDDPNEALINEIELPQAVKDFQANWITWKHLEQLHPEMTVEEVTTIVGSKGFVRGADGPGSETRRWSGPGLSHYTELVFQDGVLVSITPSSTTSNDER